jgi:hypothetical protein
VLGKIPWSRVCKICLEEAKGRRDGTGGVELCWERRQRKGPLQRARVVLSNEECGFPSLACLRCGSQQLLRTDTGNAGRRRKYHGPIFVDG